VATYQLDRLGALGDPTRRLIFERLVTAPMAVGELADQLPVSRPAVSQHLRVLKEVGLVTDQPNGTRRVYRVDPRGVEALRAYLDQLWDTALAAFAEAVERGDQDNDNQDNDNQDDNQGAQA
jgi:DNA-binding transcriptional ArsR family regulator